MTDEPIHEEQGPRKRRQIASFFQQLARRLRRGEKVSIDKEQNVAVEIPEEPGLGVELEREDGNVSLSLELEWEEASGAVETDVVASKARFEIYKDAAGKYRWRLIHRNGNIIADGSEGYASKQKAKQGLESVRNNASGAYIVDQSKDEKPPEKGGSNATFTLFEDNEGKWRWRLRHDNGNILADGGQGYSSKQKAKQGLASVQTNTTGAPVVEPE